jgi:peptide/nickel transport system substrate-binding protein
MKRFIPALLVFTLLISLMAACSGNANTAPPPETSANATTETTGALVNETTAPVEVAAEYADTFVWGTHAVQDILCPQNNVNNNVVVPNIYSGLLRTDENMNFVADIAYEWSVAEDECTWTFKLRDDVTFHNGKKLTVDDIIATFDRMTDTEHPVRITTPMSYIESYYAPDASTFVIKTKYPVGSFEADIASKRGGILDKDFIEKYGADIGTTAESCNGTGPYKVVSYKPQEEYVFEAHDAYYLNKPITKQIVMTVITEASSRTIAIETGQVDMVSNVTPEEVPRLSEVKGLIANMGQSNGCHLFQFNCASLKDPKVRQAISYAIDREPMIQALFGDLGEVPMRNVMAPAMLGWTDLGVIPHDVTKAKQLLAEAGYPNGMEIKIMTTNVYNRGIEMAEIIKENLADAGITATIQEVDRAVFSDSRASLTVEQFNEKYGWDMFIMGSGGDSDPDQLLSRIWHTDASGTNLNNYGWYSNARVDELLEKGARMVDRAERAKVYEELCTLLYIDDPVGCFINLRKNIYISKDTVEGFLPNANNTADWSRIAVRKP